MSVEKHTVAKHTRVTKNYLLPRKDGNIAAPTEIALLDPFIQTTNLTCCQEMQSDDISKIFVDLDDRCATLQAAQAQTDAFVQWARKKLAPALNVEPTRLAIATAVGSDWKENAKTGLFKASAHVVVLDQNIRWADTLQYLKQVGALDAAPTHQQENLVGAGVVDDVYTAKRQIRLINNTTLCDTLLSHVNLYA